MQASTMNNPFDQISAAFAPEYRVNLSIERLDGSIMLTLSDDSGVVARRLISEAQRNDPRYACRSSTASAWAWPSSLARTRCKYWPP